MCFRNFTKFTGKKETLAQVFSYEFAQISMNTFSQNTSGQLLLQVLGNVSKVFGKIVTNINATIDSFT